jgi:hypothetical protein
MQIALTPASATAVEPLEARIAPAVFFLSGTELTVKNAAGDDVNDATSAAAVGASLAVALKKGDSLVLDTNGNGQLDAGETVYAKVTGGRAIFFATELNATVGVQADEITGIAVSDKFKAAIKGDVSGSVATLLTPDGELSSESAPKASIAGIVVSGRISGSILATGNIAKVDIGKEATGDEIGVDTLQTGSSFSGAEFSLNGGGTIISRTYTPAEGEAGGSISNVVIRKGVNEILAGNGADSATGKGGKGGGIANLKILDALALFDIRAGNGGNSTSETSVGGAGGAITNLDVQISRDPMAESPRRTVDVSGGRGGSGNTGGAGGDMKGLKISGTVDTLHWLYFRGGNGGDASNGAQTGAGGRGGHMLNPKADFSENLVDFIGLYGGRGGAGGENGTKRGGDGGSVKSATYAALGGEYAPWVSTGGGGSAAGTASGGHGGGVSNVKIEAGDFERAGFVWSEQGGAATGSGAGGNSGSVKNVSVTGGTSEAAFFIYSSDGGSSNSGRGGKSGAISNALIELDTITEAGIFTGNGGSGQQGGSTGSITKAKILLGTVTDTAYIGTGDAGGGTDGAGGDAGNVVASSINAASAPSARSAFLYTGDGGDNSSGGAPGGDAGSIIKSSVTGGNLVRPGLFSGNGGTSAEGAGGVGGNGGTIISSRIIGTGATDGVEVVTGDGGDGAALGGASGWIKKLSITLPETNAAPVSIAVGNGGNGIAENSQGGNSGSISGVVLKAPVASVILNNSSTTAGAGNGTGSTGGKGGAVSSISGTIGTFTAFASNGGNGGNIGGAGGPISNIKFSAVEQFVQLLKAGNGGNGLTRGGAGGSVSDITVPGNIGNFLANFGFGTSDMGGIAAGLAGLTDATRDLESNGAVMSISATRIAAIVAGTPLADALTSENAVSRIAKLQKVTTIGADVDGDTEFDFTDAGDPGFNLGDGDTAIDGLVIVLSGQYQSSVTPLKLIEIS